MEGKWIYLLLLLAYYLYSAYSANKKKQEKANKELQQNNEPPKKHFNPTPTSQPLPKPMGDIFKEIFGEQNSPLPKPGQQPKPKKQHSKPVQKTSVTASSAINEREENAVEAKRVSDNQKMTTPDIPKRQGAYSFNPREAFISTVIFNRPDY